MTDVFHIQLPDGRTVGIQASNPAEAAQGARNLLASEAGQKAGEGHGAAYAFANGAGQGGTFGLGDEMLAGGSAAALWAAHKLGLGNNRDASFSDMYSQILAAARAHDRQVEKDSPTASTAGNITGNIASTVAALPAGMTAIGPSAIGNVARAAGTGALLGAAQGFGEGEGAEDRFRRAAVGGAIGGTIGAATRPLAAVGRSVAESAPGRAVSENVVAPGLQMLAAALGKGAPARSLSAAAADGGAPSSFLAQAAESAANPAERAAVERLATALQRGRLTTQSVERRLGRLGDESMLADVDPQLRSMAIGVKVLPGDTRSRAETVLMARDRGAGNRLVSAFEGNEPPPSSFELGKAFDANTRAVGARAYQGNMVEAGLKQTPELMALYENPYVNRAIDTVLNAEKQTRLGTDRAPASGIEIMHKVKQAIWDMGFDGPNARPGPNASFFRDLGTEFVNKLKAANPALAEADAAYAQAKSLPEYFGAGRSFLSRGTSEKATENSGPALADLLLKADPQQVVAARAGATNAARETALEGNRAARALAQRIDESTPVRDKLSQLYGSQRADAIMRQAEAERTFAETSNKLLRGSQTAEKSSDAIDMMGNIGFRAGPSGIVPRASESVKAFANWVRSPNEAVRDQIGKITLSSNKDENKRILQLVDALLKKRAAGTPVSASVAGAAGGQAGGL